MLLYKLPIFSDLGLELTLDLTHSSLCYAMLRSCWTSYYKNTLIWSCSQYQPSGKAVVLCGHLATQAWLRSCAEVGCGLVHNQHSNIWVNPIPGVWSVFLRSTNTWARIKPVLTMNERTLQSVWVFYQNYYRSLVYRDLLRKWCFIIPPTVLYHNKIISCMVLQLKTVPVL